MPYLNHAAALKARFSLALGLFLLVSVGAYSAPARTDWKSNSEARARILTPFGLESDGRTLWIGLEIQLEDGWHAYWKNPGDAGLAPEFTISDSGVIEALDINFPPPKFYPFGGGLDANGYADEVIYPVKLTLSESAAKQKEFTLELGLFYLVCKNLCIPHEEEFTSVVSLADPSSADNADSNIARKLKAALDLLPRAPADIAGYSASERLTRDGNNYLFSVRVNLAEESAEFPEIFFHATPDFKLGKSSFQIGESATEIIIRTTVQTKVAGKKVTEADFGYLLTKIKSGGKYISIEKDLHLALSDSEPFGVAGASTIVSSPGSSMTLWQIILFAILGGLILNIMPCVLPVLSIKLMGVVQHRGESHGKIARGMLASSAGIVTSFLALASAAVIAKSSGAAVGWGVQFQEPIFVTFLAVIVFLFGLNLWGIFEVTLPSSVSSGAARSATGRGHFVQGMFATLLATPCSAPFLGTAVSFALSSPGWIIYSVFAAMGIGMSLPYLVIAVAPGAIRFLPKPGAWMETAKIFFGFLLMGTVIWLMYVLSLQAGSGTLALVWLGLLMIGMIVWLKKALRPMARFFGSLSGLAAVFSILAVSGYTMYLAGQSEPAGSAGSAGLNSSDSDIRWTAFSEEAVREHLAAGQVVFVDVTAEWCVTCKFNEKFFIETDDIIDRINQYGIATLKADWTNRNREIGDFLARYGRSGIPFYIIYYAGDQSNYITLPITITGSMLAGKLDEAVEKNKIYTSSPRLKRATLLTNP